MLCLNLNAVKCAKRKGTHFRVPFNGADDYFVVRKLPISSLPKAFRLNLDQRYALKTVHGVLEIKKVLCKTVGMIDFVGYNQD